MAVSCPSVSTYKKKCNIQRVRVRFFGIGIYVLPKPFPPLPTKKNSKWRHFHLYRMTFMQFPQVENHTVKTINLHIKCKQFRKICDISRECDFDGVGNVCVFFFSIFIAVIPTHLLCQLKANSPGAEIPSSETGRKFRRRLFTSSIKREIKRFYVVVVQWWQKECTKKCATLAKLLFCMLSWRGCRHTLFVSDAPCKRFYFVLGWAVSIPSNVNWQHDRTGSMPADLRILAHVSGSETSTRWGTIWLKRTYFN